MSALFYFLRASFFGLIWPHMSATSQDPDVLGGELVFAGTREPVSPGQHGAAGRRRGQRRVLA